VWIKYVNITNSMSETDNIAEESKEAVIAYPLKRVTHEKVKYFPGGFKGWHFISVDDGNLSNSEESSLIQGYLKGI
jgi:hypothetical protein